MADTVQRGTGCYKCGRTGHWSRDCPSVPATKPSGSDPSPVVSARAGSSYGSQNQSSQGYKRKEFPGGDGEKGSNAFKKPAAEKALPKPPRRMPKLTPDKLLSADGLGYVLEKIPQQVEIKGRGHEVEDLKSLLESYMRWHSQILPYFAYSQFVEKVEKLGANKRVRNCVRDLRIKIANGEELKATDAFQPGLGFGQQDIDGVLDASPSNGVSRSQEKSLVAGFLVEEARRWDEDADVMEGRVDPPLDVDPPVDILNEYLEQSPDGGGRSEPQPEGTQDIRPKLVVGSGPVKESELSIKVEQRARMEANKLKALERARARKLELERSQSGAPA